MKRRAERIEEHARPEEKGNLLAATRVMAEMRYNELDLLKLLGAQAMTMQKIFDASPTIQRLKAEAARENACKNITHLLEKKFGPMSEDLGAHLRTIDNQGEMDRLHDLAIESQNLEAFRAALIDPAARIGA